MPEHQVVKRQRGKKIAAADSFSFPPKQFPMVHCRMRGCSDFSGRPEKSLQPSWRQTKQQSVAIR